MFIYYKNCKLHAYLHTILRLDINFENYKNTDFCVYNKKIIEQIIREET